MKVDMKDLKVWPMLNYLPSSLLKTVRLLYVLGTDVLLVTNDNELLVYGFHGKHSLVQNQIPKATKQVFYDVNNLVKIEELSKKAIRGFASNAHDTFLDKCMFMIIYLENGSVYLWGYNPTKNYLSADYFTTPSLIEGFSKKVTKVTCGERHFLALTECGQVFSWGDNSYGQLGHNLGSSVTNKVSRVRIKIFGDRIVDISCGSYFSVAVGLRSGSVYSWGRNDYGVLGLNSEVGSYNLPQVVTHLQNVNIRSITCGSRHVLALNEFGELYSWGSNLSGQLGIGSVDGKPNITYPQKLNSVKRFKKIVASGDLSVGVIISGKIYVWGKTRDETTTVPALCPCSTLNDVFALFKGRMCEAVTIESADESISETLAKSFGNPENSDFKIIAEEKEIHVHKTVLKLRSEYFRRMFQGEWSETKTNSVEMIENFEALSAYLKYLYTDTLDISHPEVALDVSILADKYCEPNLVELCLKKFECSLNKANVAALYELTSQRELENFSNLCVEFAFHHLRYIIDTNGFENWNPNTYKSFFSHERIKWALEK